jgi:predicted O-methyltransferase YrrM
MLNEFEMRERIAKIHGAGVLKRSAMNIRGGAGVFKRVLEGKGYGTVLEIGTYKGVSAAEISRYCDRVVTIDLVHGKIEAMGEKFDRRAFWASLGVTNVELVLVDDDEDKARVVAGLEFDLAFVDGAHDERIRDDFELVKRCGRVLFHDYDRGGVRGQDHVYDFVNALPKEQIQVMDIFALWTAPC